MKKILLSVSVCVSLLFFSTTSVLAKKVIKFGINPAVVDLSCAPGTNVSSSLKIENLSQEDGVFSFRLAGYQQTASPGVNDLSPKPTATLPADNLVRHVTIEQNIAVPKNSVKEVPYAIYVPDTLKGTQYVGISVLSDAKEDGEADHREKAYENSVGATFKTSMNLIVKCHIQNTLNYTYVVDSLEIKQKQNTTPMSAHLKVRNTGNAEVKFNPILVLTDAQKKVAARLQANKVYKILPNGTVSVEFKPSFKEVKNGSYTAVIIPSGYPEQQLKSTEIKTVIK